MTASTRSPDSGEVRESLFVLLPCPFCGGESRVAWDAYAWSNSWRVECQSLECEATMYSDEKADAIALWNRRSTSQTIASPPKQQLTNHERSDRSEG